MKNILYISIAILLPPVLLAGEWTGFRGTNGTAVSDETGLPTRWGKDDGLRWKVDLPGRGLSNPVVANKRIFLTACSGYRERRLHLLCLEEATGKKLWERSFAATGNTACHPMTNMAAPTPVTNGKEVYALFATGDLVACNREGDLLWYRSLVGDYPQVTNQVGMASSPLLMGNTLCLLMDNAGDSFLVGIDRRTGQNLWRISRPRSINWVSPLPLDSQTVLFQNDEEALAIEADTGKVRWTLKGSFSTIPSPIQGGGLIYLTGAELKAIRPKPKGAPEVVWQSAPLSGGFASPVYHQGHVYFLTNVAVLCLSTSDGKEVWRQRLDGPFDASPIIADGKLYAVNRKGRTFVVALGEQPKVLARNDLDDTILATPAVANGCLYLRSDKYLYCIGERK